MKISGDLVTLDENEMEIAAIAAKAKGMDFDRSRNQYSIEELASYGLVRESYSTNELHEKGFKNKGVTTSFDKDSLRAKDDLRVDAPFAGGVEKWQLPIDLPNFKMMMARFPPNTFVEPHVHPNLDDQSLCGLFRIVIKGSITYEGKKYGPGDWFFVPTGIPYSFVTDPDMETVESYAYQYTRRGMPVRFSNPRSVSKK